MAPYIALQTKLFVYDVFVQCSLVLNITFILY